MKRIKDIALLVVLMMVAITSWSQGWKRTQNWYFGDSAGLSFATDPPTAPTDGAMSTIEGCATMSDANGDLLFYTNGVTVWNKDHQIMENGTGLNGHVSSTQSSLIVPWPGNDSLYYIFTTDALGQPKGLQYSLVNVNANGNLGTVVSKNTLLQSPVCEKLTATHHQNGTDIWVLVHGWNNNLFYAFQITKSSIVECPVVSTIGSIVSGNLINAQGAIKFSVDGSTLASCIFNPLQSKVEIFQFDKEKGMLTYANEITNCVAPYSVEFSPNGDFLYVSSNKNSLYQYDLQSIDINASRYMLLSTGSSVWVVTTIQLGTNDKIYVSYPDSSSLGIILFPNLGGSNCGFTLNGQSLGGRKSLYGLPNMITSFFQSTSLDFDYEMSCLANIVEFNVNTHDTTQPYSWTIYKNTTLVTANSQSAFNYSFPDTGEYIVRLSLNGDTVQKILFIEPDLELGPDTILCDETPFRLDIQDNFRCVSWHDGSDSQTYTITQSGSYYVSAYNIKGCLISDTVTITFNALTVPVIQRTGDSLYTDSGYMYQWYINGNPVSVSGNQHFVVAKETGNYRVEITHSNGCSSISEEYLVTSLSVSEAQTNSFLVYPNPSQKESGIHIEGEEMIQSIQIHDLLGRLILKKTEINAYRFQINQLKRGVYILTINGIRNYKIMIE